MRRSTKIFLGIGALTAIGLAWAASAKAEGSQGAGGSGGPTPPPGGLPPGGLGGDGDPFAGPAGGGRLGGRRVDEVLKITERLPPGGILLTGPNLFMRAAAIANLATQGADWGIVVDPQLLDAAIQDELADGVDISTAQFTMVGISPDGRTARTITIPPRSATEVREALEGIMEFTGQTPKKKAESG